MFGHLADKFSHKENIRLHRSCFHRQPNSFDSIVCINVLEHIENDFDEMIKIFVSLQPRSYFLLFVPAMNFLYSRMDKRIGHYRRYNKED